MPSWTLTVSLLVGWTAVLLVAVHTPPLSRVIRAQMAEVFLPASAQLVMGYMGGALRGGALNAGIELDVFAQIDASGPAGATADEIAKATAGGPSDPRGVRILLDTLCSMDLLAASNKAKGENVRYTLRGPARRHLVPGKSSIPLYGMARLPYVTAGGIENPAALRYASIAEAVRRGGKVGGDGMVKVKGNAFWGHFARLTGELMATVADWTAKTVFAEAKKAGIDGSLKILDVASGSGAYAIAAHGAAPEGSTVTALDFDNVLEETMKNVRARGVPAAAIVPRPADLFKDDIGSGYDLIFAPNILHHFNKDECIAILRKINGALKPGGMLAIVEFVTPEGPPSVWENPGPREFSMTMLVGTDDGEAFRKTDYDSFVTAAGLPETVKHSHIVLPATILITTKK